MTGYLSVKMDQPCNEKRNVKMTEKAVDNELAKLIQAQMYAV